MLMRCFIPVLIWNVQLWEYKDDNGWRRYAPNVAAEVEQAYNERFKGIRLRITRHKYVWGCCAPFAEDERLTEKKLFPHHPFAACFYAAEITKSCFMSLIFPRASKQMRTQSESLHKTHAHTHL